jgi:orotate phosphoribosyltransferase
LGDIPASEIGDTLLEVLHTNGLIRIWPRDSLDGWVLHSGIWSPFYVDLRGLSSLKNARDVLSQVGNAFGEVIRTRAPHITRLVGVSTGGIPIAVATTMMTGIPSCYTRRTDSVRNGPEGADDQKSWGENKHLEGEMSPGDRLLLLDDLITDGSSKLGALGAISKEAERCRLSVECRDVAVILDRGQGGSQRLKGLGITLHSLIDLRTTGLAWLESRLLPAETEMIRTYLENPLAYRSKEARVGLRRLLE